MSEEEKQICSVCRYPSHAGHAKDCSQNVSKESENESLRVPIYDVNDQVFDHTKDYPEDWKRFCVDHETPDPDIFTVLVEKTKACREIDKKCGTNLSLAIGGEGLNWALDNVKFEVGESFQAHGIAKGDPIVGLDTLLTGGIQKDRTFYSMGFHGHIGGSEALGADHPFTEGGIIIVSEFEKHFTEGKIKYVILGEEYRRVVDLMRRKYPGVEIVIWHDAPATLVREYNHNTGANLAIPNLNKDNAPHYVNTNFVDSAGGEVFVPVPSMADDSNNEPW